MKYRVLVAMLVVAGVASLAFGQTPESRQSASPTSNQYRLRIMEPAEGAIVTGRTVSIVLAPLPPLPEGTSVNPAERKDALRPTFQIWVDGKDYGNLPSNQNVFTATDLAFGPHKIVVAAKNNAGELIDRKELSFSTVETASTATASQPVAPAPSEAPVMAGEPSDRPAPAPVIPPAPPAPATTTYSTSNETLPTTATAHPSAALGGLVLVALGLALRRRNR
jgi:hypothetical protein